MLEVLITIVIIAFGLLGLASLQSKFQVAEVESYQRVQATLLMDDISERINADRGQAASYVSADPIGTDDSQPADCSGLALGAPRDICEWSLALKGASETKSTAKVGGMIDARGCITQIQASDPTPGTCTPGIYEVTVIWRGLHQTIAPGSSCGKFQTDDTYRRAITTRISVGLPDCQ
ncbi:MAG: type IV pilus modification protein PilV [Burkholderiales bacterium]|nr:type IV pilus modification protein PilV [Burkholderiales bacterium]